MSLDCEAALHSGGRVLSRASTFDSQLTCNYSISQRVFFVVASLALSDVVRSIDAVHLCELHVHVRQLDGWRLHTTRNAASSAVRD